MIYVIMGFIVLLAFIGAVSVAGRIRQAIESIPLFPPNGMCKCGNTITERDELCYNDYVMCLCCLGKLRKLVDPAKDTRHMDYVLGVAGATG